jgi:thiamine kinase-like enzyme
MPPPDPSEAAHRYVPGVGAPLIRRSRGGGLNHTYRVVRDERAYAMRLSGRSARWATHPHWECRVLALAADAGLAPAVHDCDPAAGVLVSSWVEGRVLTPADAAADGVARMAALMRRIHALKPPQPPRAVSPAGWVAYYGALLEGAAASASAAVPASAAVAETRRLQSAAAERLRGLAELPAEPPVLCHGDLHPLNMLETDRGVVLLDWEYSHVTHPYWDLAAWSSANDWGAEPRWALLRAYGGADPPPRDCLRFDLLAWIYDYVCLAWSALYALGPVDGGSSDAEAAAWVAARAQRLAERLDEYPVVAAGELRHTTLRPASDH